MGLSPYRAEKTAFFVSYYPKASEFDPEPSEDQKAFHDFCEHTGWILAATSAQMQIFYNERENPTPIETDPALEVGIIHRAAKKAFLPLYFVLLAISLFSSMLFISTLLSDPISLLASSSNLFTGFAWTMLLLLCITELFGYYSWRSRAIKAAERGEFLDISGHSRLLRFIFWTALIGFAYWLITLIMIDQKLMLVIGLLMVLYMALLFFLVNIIKQYLKSKKAPASVNRTVTMVSCFILSFAMMGAITFGTLRAVQSGAFKPDRENQEDNLTSYLDELPLTVEDLLDIEFDGYIREHGGSESLILSQFTMRQHARFDSGYYAEVPSLEYTITAIKIPSLYEICKEQMLCEQDERNNKRIPDGHKKVYEVHDAVPWGAQEVYRLVSQDSGPMNWYLLCYKDRIIEIKFDWEPTPEQMKIVAEKLSGEKS
ncbi:MAG: hypothetical protein PWQ93_275 [Clostridiales bacterium]|nr:hypothetical protein [Clostridiales bacterium]